MLTLGQGILELVYLHENLREYRGVVFQRGNKVTIETKSRDVTLLLTDIVAIKGNNLIINGDNDLTIKGEVSILTIDKMSNRTKYDIINFYTYWKGIGKLYIRRFFENEFIHCFMGTQLLIHKSLAGYKLG